MAGKKLTMDDLEAINFPHYYNLVKEGKMKKREVCDLLFNRGHSRYDRYVRFLEGKPTYTEAIKRRNKKHREKKKRNKGKTPEQIKAEWKQKLNHMTEEQINQHLLNNMIRIRIKKDDTVLIKRCTDCGKYKKADEFNKCKTWKDGINKICLKCSKKRKKERRQTPEGKASHKRANHKRRAKIKENGGTWTLEEWEACLKFFDNKCAYTGQPMNVVTMDHIVALNKGGTNNISNIIPADVSPNSSKCDKDLWEWYSKQPYFSWERYLKICLWIIKNGGASKDINIKE